MRIYVASSWRNNVQPSVVTALREAGHAVYDFKNPQSVETGRLVNSDLSGFSWREIDPDWEHWTNERYIAALSHPVAEQAYQLDHGAMEWSEVGVLVLPCGRSAHTEIGYYDGAEKPFFILLPDPPMEPELMYKSATGICTTVDELLDRISELHTPTQSQTRVRVCVEIQMNLDFDSDRSFAEAHERAREAAYHAVCKRLNTGKLRTVRVVSRDVLSITRSCDDLPYK